MSLTRTTLNLTRQLTTTTRRTLSISALRMAEGDTGGVRSGGAAQGDAFSKREAASESQYVREQEKRKLDELRKRIADKEADLAKDRKDVEEMSKQK